MHVAVRHFDHLTIVGAMHVKYIINFGLVGAGAVALGATAAPEQMVAKT